MKTSSSIRTPSQIKLWLEILQLAPIEARFWVGDEHPEAETYTGDLIFVDSEQEPQKIAAVGRVTFSEGVRMASQIFAKRKVEKQEGGEQ